MRYTALFWPVLFLISLSGFGSAAQTRRAVHRPAATKKTVAANHTSQSGDSEAVRPGSQGPSVVRAQILLDRAHFSPGEIDGRYGEDLGIAIKGFQEAHHLKPSGIVDGETWKLLNVDTKPLTTSYTITQSDIKGPFVPIPKELTEQASLQAMGYESVEEELGEKFHVSPKLLADMNAGKNLSTPGEQIEVPALIRHAPLRAARVVVSKSKRTVIAYGLRDRILAQYPATIGGVHDPLPIGRWTIVSVQQNPWFNYDPVHFWNARPDATTAKLPPGPNNPAGVVWMGLSKQHYGIHGTPDPGHIRHGESAGCIRLTNWDAEDLSHMVRRGTPALLEE